MEKVPRHFARVFVTCVSVPRRGILDDDPMSQYGKSLSAKPKTGVELNFLMELQGWGLRSVRQRPLACLPCCAYQDVSMALMR